MDNGTFAAAIKDAVRCLDEARVKSESAGRPRLKRSSDHRAMLAVVCTPV